MRVVLCLLLLLCGYRAQGEDGDLTEQTLEQTTPDIWAEMTALRDMVVELQVELRTMENRVMESDRKVEELKTELTVTKMYIELLQIENSGQATDLISLESRLTSTESKTSDLENENADFQTRLSDSESELVISKSRIDQLERENAEKPKVAFYTALTNAGSIGPYNTDITLKFTKVFTNTGNAYSAATGFFTAPVRGVYYFQFTVCGSSAGLKGVHVYKNSQKIMYSAEWKEHPNIRYFTNSVVLELFTGDIVYLRLPKDHGIFDNANNYSTFSGSLLFPL
ncbi:bradykinin receptor B2 [Sarotherodon galilaeus]